MVASAAQDDEEDEEQEVIHDVRRSSQWGGGVTGAGECVSKCTRGGRCGVTTVIAQLSVAVALGKRSWNAGERRGRRAAWERGAAVRAQQDTSLAIEQGFGGIQGQMGSEDVTGYLGPMRPLHPEPERIRLLKHESDLSSFACVYGLCFITSCVPCMCES
ncbi:hypothetical protein Q7C36_020533 [Tachysurus vachellii]|uniref:Uncharacterized protein n=1 Tax=Tachysurus vachellii TaxID=175792 RepID=A0AA88IV27_TACVA|nr:hypothetical protein Q7C36_020533 [Tachysurus vachellii]